MGDARADFVALTTIEVERRENRCPQCGGQDSSDGWALYWWGYCLLCGEEDHESYTIFDSTDPPPKPYGNLP